MFEREMRLKLLVFVIVLSLPLSIYGDGGKDGVFFLKVKKDGLNLRADSRVNAQLIAKLRRGDVLVGVGKSYEWYKVRLPQRVKVYLYRKYTKTAKDGEVEVIADRVNVRSGPGLSYAVLGQANNGDRFKLCRHQLGGDWFCVLAGEHRLYGWVHERGVEILVQNEKKGKDLEELEESKQKNIQKKSVERQKVVSQPVDQIKANDEGKIEEISQDKSKDEKKDLPIAKGIVREMGRILGVKYRYKLVSQSGKVLYYLSCDKEMVAPFVNKEVFVFGEVSSVVRNVPVLSVKKIALTRVGLGK